MPTTTLLLGTTNPKKIEYYQRFLKDLGLKIVTASDLRIKDPEETGSSIEENARLKAKYYCEQSNITTLADDAGFEIPVLKNFPGTLAHRFAGEEMSDDQVVEEILLKMRGLKGDARKARMKVVLALALNPDKIHLAAGEIVGIVPEKSYEKRMKHFPYRSLLYLPSQKRWFYDLTDQEEEEIGYRAAAIKQLIPHLNREHA